MRIAAINTADAWFSTVSSQLGPDMGMEIIKDVQVANQIEMESVYMMYEGEDLGYRPFAMLVGHLTTTIPAEELPYGITELMWPAESVAPIAYRYDFTDAQIANMVVNKGLYRPGFELPEQLKAEWLLEGKADFFIVSPLDETAVPAAFVEISDATTGRINASSGYDLVEFMPDVVPESMLEIEEQAEAGFDDVVIEDALEPVEAISSEFVKVEQEVEKEEHASSFAELMKAAAQKRQARELALQAEAERIRSEGGARDVAEVADEIAAEVEEVAAAEVDNTEEEQIMAAVETITDQVAVEAESSIDIFDGFVVDDSEISEQRDRELRASAQAAIDDAMVIDDEIVIEDELT